MDKFKCPDCPGKLKYLATAGKNDKFVKLFRCNNPECGHEFEYKYYRYSPSNCPKHQWEFVRWNFKENQHTHEIFWEMKCDRCGKINTENRLDSRAVGLRESVDLEDPRVNNLLALNEQTARFHMDADEVTDFWNS